jgi:hypothetical protein
VRFYLKFIPILALIFLVFLLTARAIGATRPPNPALRGFVEGCEDKPQPCWYGIVPGVTTVEEANLILASHDYWERSEELVYYGGYQYVNIGEAPSCVTLVRYGGDTILSGLRLGCLGIRLGDVISQWGVPKRLGYGEVRAIDGLGYAGYSFQLHRSDLQPYLWMYEVSLSIPLPDIVDKPFGVYRWRGFTSFQRYCQLNQMFWVCGLQKPFSSSTINNSSANYTVLPTLPSPPILPTLSP